ncbi:hypothetical protein E2C01_005985 [Portunus trituberculatus]|uniref:Uncharacterized protein n=1 Tax=Portunus trituberculatus TaxID=210409 RepID=A0A5B7CV23_PORTR|nr:hypothetical protein [Portunus trituberculatus]
MTSKEPLPLRDLQQHCGSIRGNEVVWPTFTKHHTLGALRHACLVVVACPSSRDTFKTEPGISFRCRYCPETEGNRQKMALMQEQRRNTSHHESHESNEHYAKALIQHNAMTSTVEQEQT